MTDTTDKLIIQAETPGVQQSTDQLNQLGKSMDGVSVASDKIERSTTSLDGKFQALERRFGTTAGNAAQFAKVQDTVNKAVAQNPALLEQGNAVLDAARVKYGQVADAEKALGEAHAGLSGQAQALQHAFRSTVDSLASGAPVTQVLGQEFGRLSYVMSGQGGVSGAFKELSGIFSGILTPMNLAIGGTVALAAAAAALALQYDKVQVSSQRAIGGAGARTGTSVSDLNNFTSQNSSTFGLSQKEARGLAEDLTNTGEIVVSRLHGMSDAVVGFANQTGKSMDEARKDFVGFAVDPKKGLDDLATVFGDFDLATRRSVESLAVAGDKTGAFQVIIDALSEKSKNAAANMGFFEKAVRGVVNVLATSTVKPSGLEDQLEKVRTQLNAAIDSAQDPFARDSGEAAHNVEVLSKAFADLQQSIEKVNGQKAADELKHVAAEADNDVKAILPQINALDVLQKKINELNEAKEKGVAPGNADAALAVYEHQADLLQQSLDTTVRQAQVANTLVQTYGGVSVQTALTLNNLQLQLNAAQALTGAAQMQAAAQATYTNLVVQGVAQEEAAAISAKQLAVSQAAATTQVLKQVEALKDQDSMIKAQQNGTEATTAAAIAYKHAIESGADETAAAALKAQTLKNAMDGAAGSAQSYANALQGALEIAGQLTQFNKFGTPYNSNGAVGGGSDTGSHPFGADDPFGLNGGSTGVSALTPLGEVMKWGEAIAAAKAALYANGGQGLVDKAFASGSGVDGAIAALKAIPLSSGKTDINGHPIAGGDFQSIFGNIDSLYQLKNATTSSNSAKVANLSEEMAWLQKQPASLAQQTAIANLQQSIDNLKKSTDSLNSTNQDLLSPYYSQDPRTSHIGFRSQGMADGGYVDVPGGVSANDNMLALIPVASGERIFVDPMASRRGVGGGSQSITINVPITIVGNANKDEIGRTVYQAAQAASRQLAAAAR